MPNSGNSTNITVGNGLYSSMSYNGVNNEWQIGLAPVNSSDGSVSMSLPQMLDAIKELQKRMVILEENIEKHERFPALKEAYENYLAIERLCTGDSDQK